MANGQSFGYQLRYFERWFNVFAPDLKGFGKNTGMDYPYCLDDYIQEVKEYIYKNGLKKPSVIAHSFGGRIAIKAASEDKNAFNKIVLTGAAGLKPKFSLKKATKKQVFSLLKKFIGKEKLINFYSAEYRNLSPVMKESFIKIVNEYLDDKLKNIENEVLIIFGANDKETPLYMAKRLKKGITNAKYKVINGAGHFCFIEKPNKFNAEVKEFLLS